MRWFFLLIFFATGLGAQEQRVSHCIALAEATPGLSYVHKASFREPVPAEMVRLRFIDHSAFLLQTEGGLSAVTDYPGFIGAVDFVPDVVTMNHGSGNHWTPNPDPAIPHVLKGWGPYGEGIDHALDLGEMFVRNVSTDIRSQFGMETEGNSIFVFEVAGLCIGHLGHLHHEPNAAQYAALGRLDVVMTPVDGGLTLDHGTVIRIMQRLRSSIVLPMHWFGRGTLDAFLDSMSEEFDIVRTGESDVLVSLRTLPDRPTVVVLEPKFLSAP